MGLKRDRRTADGHFVARIFIGRQLKSKKEMGYVVPKKVSPIMKEVWTMLAWGLAVKEISQALGISTHAVESAKYRTMVYFRIYDWDLAFFVRLAIAFGLVDNQKPIT